MELGPSATGSSKGSVSLMFCNALLVFSVLDARLEPGEARGERAFLSSQNPQFFIHPKPHACLLSSHTKAHVFNVLRKPCSQMKTLRWSVPFSRLNVNSGDSIRVAVPRGSGRQ